MANGFLNQLAAAAVPQAVPGQQPPAQPPAAQPAPQPAARAAPAATAPPAHPVPTMLRPPATAASLMPGAKPGLTRNANGLQVVSAGMYEPYIQRAAQMYTNVPADLIRAVGWVESSFNPNAKGPVTRGGRRAKGIMQLEDETAHSYDVYKPFVPESNIDAGAHYLSDMLSRYDGDVRKALAAYNWGPENLDRANGDLAKAPAETKAYIDRVLSFAGPGGAKPGQTTADPSGLQGAIDKLKAAHASYDKNPTGEAKDAFIAAGRAYRSALARAQKPGSEADSSSAVPVAPYDPLPSFFQQVAVSRMRQPQRDKFLAQQYPGSRILKDERQGAPEEQFLLTADGKRYSLQPSFGAGLTGDVPQMLAAGAAGTLGAAGGFLAGGPPGAIAGGLMGAGAGAASEQAMEEDIKSKAGLGDTGRAGEAVAKAGAWGAAGEAVGPALKGIGLLGPPLRRAFTGATKESGALQREVAAKGGSLPLSVATPGMRHFIWIEQTANKLLGVTSAAAKRNMAVVHSFLDDMMAKAGLSSTAKSEITSRLTSNAQFDVHELGAEIRASLPAVPTKVGEKVTRTVKKGVTATKEEITKGTQTTERSALRERAKGKTTTITKEDVKPAERAERLFNQMRGMSDDQIVEHVLRTGEAGDLRILNDTLSPKTMAKVRQVALRQIMLGALPEKFSEGMVKTKLADLGLRKNITQLMKGYTDEQRAILFPNGLDKDLVRLSGVIDEMFPGTAADVGMVGMHTGAIQTQPILHRWKAMAVAALGRWVVTNPAVVTRLADGLQGSPAARAEARNVVQGILRYAATEAAKPGDQDPDSLAGQVDAAQASLGAKPR